MRFLQAALFAHTKEYGGDEGGHYLNGHAAEGGDGHGNHNVRTATGGGEDGDQGEDRRGRSHHTGTDPPQSGINRGCADAGNGGRRRVSEALTEVGTHNDAVVGGDAEEREESNPDRDAEVDGVNLKEVAQVDAK